MPSRGISLKSMRQMMKTVGSKTPQRMPRMTSGGTKLSKKPKNRKK